MRYEDASGSFQASGPIANDDSDTLPAGSRQAATGNLITGEGTQYGSAGADSAAGAHITSIAGKGGEDTSFAGGKLSVTGEHGNLSVDAEGNYNYMANKGAPENVRDRFTYTLADSQGNSDTAALIIELGKTPVVIKADAQQIVPGPDGVVTLPPGVDLSDVMVVGRNLVINMPDGTQLIIVDGAIFVPQLVFDGVQVPATNVAALLIGQEPQPAAGELPPSSGGNFALPPPPLDPGVPLGDLIPPTVRDYIPPEPQEVFDEEDNDPEVTIEPVDQAPSVNAVDEVDEAGLPVRGIEPEGSGEEAAAGDNGDPSEATSGVIHIDSPDGVDSVTINGELVTGAIGQEIEGDFGTLTITGFAGDDILYSYVLNDNTSGDDTHDDFVVTLTDDDGDVAVATLVIDIIDDVPTARDDVDSVTEGGPEVADGNVLTGSGGADANSTDGVADTVGADDADLTGFSQGGNNGTLGAPFAAQYGTLVLNADGSYTYTLDSDDPAVQALGDGDTLTEVFTYTLEDGDGDVDTATLTITINGTNEAPVIGNDAAVVSEEGLPDGIEDTNGDPTDETDSATDSGTISVSDPDGDPVTVTLSTNGLPNLTSNTVPIIWALSDGGHTLTGTAGGDPIITITIDDDGNWDVELTGPIDHADETVEDVRTFDVQVTVDDGSETDTGTLTVTIEDDSPLAGDPDGEPPVLLVDESPLPAEGDGDNSDSADFSDVFGPDQFGGDGPGEVAFSLALSSEGASSGLFALDNTDADAGDGDGYGQGDEILLFTEADGSITGRLTDGGDVYFTISVDDVTGEVTLTRNPDLNLWHSDNPDGDDAETLEAEEGTLVLVKTVTDADHDSDTAEVDLSSGVFAFEDDGPEALDDTDSIPSGGDTAEGNVITGAGTNDGAGSADDPGTDSPGRITEISGFGGTDNTFSGGVLEIDGQYGTLEIDEDGNYTYTRFPESPGNVQDVFTYTLTDADGDSTTATLTINIGNATPILPDPDLVQLDDDDVNSDGNPGGIGDDDPSGLPGQLDGSGGDGTRTYNFTGDDTLPDGFSTTEVDDSTLEIYQGTTLVLTVTLTNATGAFNVVQENPIVHEEGDDENNYEFVIGVEVEDSDGDTEPAHITINVDDDTPLLEDVQSGGGVTLDESDGLPNSDTSLTPVISADKLFGADGPASVDSEVFGLQIVGGDGTDSGLRTAQGDFVITLEQIDGDTIEGHYNGSNVAFIIQMNGDGTVTLTQNVALEHNEDGGPAPIDHNDALDLDGLIEATLTITDADGDTASASTEIGGDLVFLDDGPTSEVDGEVNVPTLTLDETRPLGDDGEDTDDGDEAPSGLATVTVGFADNFQAGDFGTDGAGTTAYTLILAADGSGSGMYALDNSDTDDGGDGDGYGQGVEIELFDNAGVIEGRVGTDVYFTIEVNSDGEVTFTQLLNVWHEDTTSDDDSSGLSAAAETLQLEQTITDSDGDFDTSAIDLSDGVFFIEDDGPTVFEFTDAEGDNVGPNPTAEGIFDFDIGTDSPNGGNDDIFIDPDSVVISINGVALDPSDITFGEAAAGEDEHTAEYEFSFIYDTGDGNTDTINGTLIFYKDDSVVGHDAGTYEVVLDGPVQAFTILQTATGTDFTGYDLNTANETGSQPDVAVTQLRGDPDNPDPTDLFIQFTSIAEPGNGTGANNLETTQGTAGTFDPVTSANFANLELFTQEAGWVSASGSENGVNGDTVGQGEVLDFNLYMGDNPQGFVGDDPTATATTMFLKFDGITNPNTPDADNAEDLIVILKLYDPVADTFTTRALIVQNSDIQKGPGAGPGQFSGITLDNNDGLIIIEPNDYQQGNTNLVIVGAQIVAADEGITGTGINFNNTTGAGGSSSGTELFSTDNNDGPLKISSIGFVTADTTDQSVTIDFDVTVTDVDGDSETTALSVQIGDPPDTLAATSFSSASQEEQLQKIAANSNTLTLAAAVAGAGLADKAAAHSDHGNNGHHQNADLADFAVPSGIESYSVDDGGSAAVSMLAPEASSDVSAPADTSSSSSSDSSSSSNSLDDSAAKATPEPSDLPAGDDGAADSSADAAGPVAPTVAMVSAEALEAAANDNGNAQQGGSVEQIVADALHEGSGPNLDAVLANLPDSGNGALQAIAHMASPDGAAVSGWNMGSHGAIGAGLDMMFKMDVAMHHQDAVQPVQNG